MRPPLSYIPLLPVLLLLVAAISVMHFILPPNYPVLKPNASQHTGMVEEATEGNSGTQLTLSLPELHPYKARITIPSISMVFSPGDSITFYSKLSLPKVYDRYRNDHRASLLRKNIYAQAFVVPDSVNVIGENQNIYWRIKRLQPELCRMIKKAPLSSPTIEFLCASLLGDDSLLTDSTRSLFSGAGVAHVLALSGLHVGIITVLITIILFPLYILRMRKTLLGATIILLWVYAVLTGLSPSVTRAVIMATTLGIGIILQRRNFSFNALLLAAIIILLFNPDALFNAGFQLSFASVSCILLVLPIIERLQLQGIVRYLVTIILVTIAATIGSGAIAAYYFHSFPLFFLFANIPVLLLLPWLMGAGIFILILQSFTTVPDWLCYITDWIYDIINRYVEVITSIPHSTIDHIFFSEWVFVPYFLCVGMLFASFHYRKKIIAYLSASMGVATIIVALLFSAPLNAEEYFIVHSFRDTTLLHRKHNKVTLYTTAPSTNAHNIEEKVKIAYSEYLMRHNVDTIATLHTHDDIVNVRGKKIMLLSKNNISPDLDYTDISHVVICRGFSDNPLNVHSLFPEAQIILSCDLHPRRHNRYIDSLDKYNIPVMSLRTDFNADIFSTAPE